MMRPLLCLSKLSSSPAAAAVAAAAARHGVATSPRNSLRAAGSLSTLEYTTARPFYLFFRKKPVLSLSLASLFSARFSTTTTTPTKSGPPPVPLMAIDKPPFGGVGGSLAALYNAQRRYSVAATTATPTTTSAEADDRRVRIVEVGARDGLQNEKTIVPVKTKIELIERLSRTGLRNIEAGSFVSPKWVPQMADTSTILTHLSQKALSSNSHTPPITYSYLVPNLRGLESALTTPSTSPPPEIAIFASASEGFSHANLNCSIATSLTRFHPVAQLAQKHNIPIRGYVSMIFSCPYSGPTPPQSVASVTNALLDMGCYEVSLGDTNGVGTPEAVNTLLSHLIHDAGIPASKLAAHFHDTYGMALVNSMAALSHGIRVFDSSVAGLGGCPYAKGATGNVSTEDLVYFLQGMGYETGVELEMVAEVGEWISRELGRKNGSKVGPALLAVRESRREKEMMERGRRESEAGESKL